MRQDDQSLRTNLVSGLESLHTEIEKVQNKLTSLQSDTFVPVTYLLPQSRFVSNIRSLRRK